MKYLVIADVHANLPAFRKVLRITDYDRIIHAGDIVGYYTWPNECISLMPSTAINVLGNHDRDVLSRNYISYGPHAKESLKWTLEQLTPSSISYLKSLQDNVITDLDGVRTAVMHGGPLNHVDQYVYSHTSSDILNNYLKNLRVKVLILGHTHEAFARRLKDGWIINPGSIGQPRDGSPNPSYIIMEIINNEVKINLKRFSYDIKKTADSVKENLLPKFLAERLYSGI